MKKTILIVDDDIAHRTMLRISLSSEYHIEEAGNGSSAIARIQENAFDLIIMDVRMPVASGFDALSTIKAHNPNLPVVMVTANTSPDDAGRAQLEGAYDYLSNPFDFDTLRKAISNALA